MRQYILRIREDIEDVEILLHDDIEETDYFYAITLKDLQEKVNSMGKQNEVMNYRANLRVVTDEYIAIGPECTVLRQEGHKRIVTYNDKAYNINFPNAIYFINHSENKVVNVEAYCYREYLGLDTNLYKYAMPNMLTENRICMGSAPKTIKDNNFTDALEKIIFTQFTHATTNNIKSFKETEKYFKYLVDNDFPYDLLIDTNRSLKKLIK